MDRINIDGTWYVREDLISPREIDLDYTWSECFTVETDEYCFEVSRIKQEEDGDFYPDIGITFTDKTPGGRHLWKKEYWDGNPWMLGIIDNNPESFKELQNYDLSVEGLIVFKRVLNKALDKGWLKRN